MSNLEGYLISLEPPAIPGSAIQRALCDYVRKLGASESVDSALNQTPEPSDVESKLRPRHDNHLPDVSSLMISNTTTPRPRPDPLRVSTSRTYNSGERSPGISDSASDVASPVNTDSVGSISETSDSEVSPLRSQASHRVFNIPMYMPLPSTGTSTSARRAVPGPDIPGHKLVKLHGREERFMLQLFIIRVKIDQEIPREFAATLSQGNLPSFRLIFDPGYSAIWMIGSRCQKMVIPHSDVTLPLTLPLNNQYYQGFYDLEGQDITTHAQIFVHHHCPEGRPIVPATIQLPNVHYGCTKFINTVSAAVVALTAENHQLRFVNCVQWDKVSWDAQFTISSPIGVAHCLTPSIYTDKNMDGIIGFAPSDSQTIFDLVNPLEAPSVLASLQSACQLAHVDNSDDGIVVYCAMRPFALWSKDQMKIIVNPYESWIALNKWPIRIPDQPETSKPKWSDKIKIFLRDASRPTWNILLLSMKFMRFHPDVTGRPGGTWLPVPNGEIVFDGGLVTVLDPGCAASWVPPEIVRCVRTALFPCTYNQDLDRRLGDQAVMTWTTDVTERAAREINYAVEPANVEPHLCMVVYRFLSSSPSGNTVVEVQGPVDQFVCALNPEPKPVPVSASHVRPEREGLLFVAPPGSLVGANGPEAIFGVNFFQSMFVALHKPRVPKRRPYVRLAPQWHHEIRNFGAPPHVDDDY